ncbi:MAG: flap endonuclease, partial [Acidimicrobiales bacterium]|nr:flap endonuclease [Acidimicrobiales bacterium]
MQVHLVDGTYELFRYHFALPSHVTKAGQEVGATRGVAGSMLQLLEDGATHVGVATDHVIESFRNDLWATYKDGSGADPVLLAQF